MRLHPWQILTCCICLASDLQSQEVRRALPVTPTPEPAPRALPVAPRAQPVYPDQPAGQSSILDENMPSPQNLPRRPAESSQTSNPLAAVPPSRM